jgi:DNA-binding transcriptional regulator YiaG
MKATAKFKAPLTAAELASRYPVTVRWDNQDQIYIGTIHSLVGDACHGTDAAAVFAEARQLAAEVVELSFREPFELPTPPQRVAPVETEAREIRDRLALSQAQFAKMLGISLKTYLKWEHGERVPTGPGKALLRLAEAKPEFVRAVLS